MCLCVFVLFFFFFQAEDGIRDRDVTGVQRVLFRSAGKMSGSKPPEIKYTVLPFFLNAFMKSCIPSVKAGGWASRKLSISFLDGFTISKR